MQKENQVNSVIKYYQNKEVEKRKPMKDYIDSLFQFIENSPTCYQAVEQIKQRLAENGYRSLDEKTPWQICIIMPNISILIRPNK